MPNISFGPAVVKALRPLSPPAVFDVHLMCSQTGDPAGAVCRSRRGQITSTWNWATRVAPLIWKIKSLGKKVGLAINPPTAIAQVQPHLDQIELLLIMTVNPGFGGQSFIHETLPKIQQAAAWRRRKRRLPHRGGRRHQLQDGGGLRQGGRGHFCQRHGAVPASIA